MSDLSDYDRFLLGSQTVEQLVNYARDTRENLRDSLEMLKDSNLMNDNLLSKLRNLPRAKWGDDKMTDLLRKWADEDHVHRTFLLEVADALEVVLARAEAAEEIERLRGLLHNCPYCGAACKECPCGEAELTRLRVVEKAAWRVVGNYTPDPDATNEDEYEIGAKDVEDLRAALRAALEKGAETG